MKILALGGCGLMGRMAVAILLESPKVTSVTIADRDVELAKTVIDLIGSNKLLFEEIDVTQKENLIKLISAHDLVINTVGPYYKFGKIIFEAVIEAKKNYVDICDDWKPMMDILDLDEKAKAAGITAIIGLGASPGISNILAVIACSEFDEVDDLISAWGVSFNGKKAKKPKFYIKNKTILKKLNREKPEANAALEHVLYESIGKIPTFKDGELIDIDALTVAPPLDFPGCKKMYVSHIGHPEPITLSRTLKAKTISNQMFLGVEATDLLRSLAKQVTDKKLTLTEATNIFDKKSTRIIIKYLLTGKMIKVFRNAPPTISVIATGTKDGIKKRVGVGIYHVPYDEFDGLSGITSVPLAVGALMLIDGVIKKKGALTPEESIDPDEFLKRMAPFCGKNLKGSELLLKREEIL